MALESISNKAVAYQEVSRPLQKVAVKSISEQNMKDTNTVTIGTTEMLAAAKVLNEQQDSTNEGSQQKKDAQANAQANAQRMKSAVTQANNTLKQVRTGCEFSYHEETNRVSIKVYDKDTQEVIREIPPEESLEMLEKAWEIAGLLVDERR